MKAVTFTVLVMLCVGFAPGQDSAQKVFATEKAFETMVSEKGINAGFVEFMAPDGVIFTPDAVNGRDAWKNRPASPALLTWNPIWIEVSSNGALAYSIGNGVYRAKGPDDATPSYTHYLSIWSRQTNGEYRAVLDTGIVHDKPGSLPTEWKSPAAVGNTKLQNSAADHALYFYSTVDQQGAVKAYKTYLADDAFLMRNGSLPFVGKKAAVEFLESTKPMIKFAKRKTFIEAGDLAWVQNLYAITDKSGTEIERGNFIQVWKLRDGKWLIAADVFAPMFVNEK